MMWVFIILFTVLGIVSIVAPKVTRFLYSWGPTWYAKKEQRLSRIRLIGVGYLAVALVLWLIASFLMH